MLTLPIVLLLVTVVNTFYDDHCCCGCIYPCPVTIPVKCGAPPTTPCEQKEYFNNSELLSPLIIKLHDLTAGVTRDVVEEHSNQPVPIGKDEKKPNSVTVTDSLSAAKNKNAPSIFSTLFSFPKFLFSNSDKGEVVRNETKTVNGSVIKETDPTKAKQKWHEIIGGVRHGISRMDDGFTTMQHGLVDSFDSLFRGVVDGVFNILRTAR